MRSEPEEEAPASAADPEAFHTRRVYTATLGGSRTPRRPRRRRARCGARSRCRQARSARR